jgi:hypothetical protein
LRVVEPEEQRADPFAVALLVPAEARDHAVRGARVLDLDHHTLAGLVGAGLVLGDHPVEPGALETMEPLLRNRPLTGAGRQVDWPTGPRERAFQPCAAVGLRPGAKIVAALCQEIEGDEGRRRLCGELRHPRGRRMQAHLQRLEVEPMLARDDDLSVDHAARGKAGQEAGAELREVTIEGFQVAALEIEVVAVTEHDRAEAVPLRFEEPPVARRHLRRELGQHRLYRRLDRESHR